MSPETVLANRQIVKLDLEIESLKRKNKWEFAVQFMPVIATVMGVIGFFFTVFVFQSQRSTEQTKDRLSREVEQRTKLQNQIRADADEVLRSTGNERLTISRVVFLLEDMKTVLSSKIEDQKMSDILKGYERSLTESLVVLVRDDCDFDDRRGVELADAVAAYWDDYSNYLSEENEDFAKLNYILYKYIRALQSLRDQNPGYLQSLKPTAEGDGLDVRGGYPKLKGEAEVYAHLLDIFDGFKLHLQIFDKSNAADAAKKMKKSQVEEFEATLNNSELSRYVLGNDFLEVSKKNAR